MKIRGAGGEKPVIHITGPDQFAIDIVGESHYAQTLEQLAKGMKEVRFINAVIVPETDNPYGADAVRIDIDGKTVGHLSKALAPIYRQRLEAAGHPGAIAWTRAILRGRPQGEEEEGHGIGVWLDLPYTIGELTFIKC
jgi:hypothetical protein